MARFEIRPKRWQFNRELGSLKHGNKFIYKVLGHLTTFVFCSHSLLMLDLKIRRF